MGKICSSGANFVEPTEHSAICDIYFSPDCYEESFMVEMGQIKSATFWCCTGDTASSSNKIGWKGASDLLYSTRWPSAT